MMGDIRVKSLEEQVDKLTRRAEKAEARVAEIESHQEDLEVSRSQAVAEKDRYRARVAELEADRPKYDGELKARVQQLKAGRLPPAAKHARRFWSNDPEGFGFEYHSTWESARATAVHAISEWSGLSASEDGEWPDAIEFVRWGVVVEAAAAVPDPAGGEGVVGFELRQLEDERKEGE